MADTTQNKPDFEDAYKEARELEKQVVKAEDARKTKLAKQDRGEIGQVFTGAFDETRKMTEEEAEGIKTIRRPAGVTEEDIGKAFALKMNTEFGVRPEEFKQTLKTILEEIIGVPIVMDEKTNAFLNHVAKELGDKPVLYYHPDQFESLKIFLKSDTVGLGVSEDIRGPSEEELNDTAKQVINLLYERVFEKTE